MTYYKAPSADIIGNVHMGENSSVFFHAVIRADENHIYIGNNTNVQDGVVIHTDPDRVVRIGDFVTIGHGAIIHGCEIEDGALIGMGCIIMNGAKIGRGATVGAGALVTENTVVPEGAVVVGVPGKAIKILSEEEIKINWEHALDYVELARKDLIEVSE